MPKKILIVHGPNLNFLGKRERAIYGRFTLSQINEALRQEATRQKIALDFFQSNHEGEIVGKLQQADGRYVAVVLNPAGLTHTSVAIRDAIAAIRTPVIEVHLSNIHAREEFRKQSYISPVARGVVFGFGKDSYLLGLQGAVAIAKGRGKPSRYVKGNKPRPG